MNKDKRNKGFKESWRKFIVSLKKRPHNIPFTMMIIAFVAYSFNLTKISNTTAVVNRPFMGLSEFVIMLFSILAFVCFLNAFPRRQKPVTIMVILLYAMQAIILFCDFVYISNITAGLQTIEVTQSRLFIPQALSVLRTHMILVICSIVLIALIPVLGKLLGRIDTSVALSDNEDVDIELTDEDDSAEASRSGGKRNEK